MHFFLDVLLDLLQVVFAHSILDSLLLSSLKGLNVIISNAHGAQKSWNNNVSEAQQPILTLPDREKQLDRQVDALGDRHHHI